MIRVAHMSKHIDIGGIPVYLLSTGKALQNLGVKQIIISSGGTMATQFHKAGIQTFDVDVRTKSELHPKLLFQIPRIIRILRQQNINLIHAHTRVTQVLAAIIHQLTGIPYITTAHGIFKRRMGRYLFPAWGRKVIAISSFVKKNLINQHGLFSKNVLKIRNGIALERFHGAPEHICFRQQFREQLNIPADHFVVCVISRLIQEKGIGDLLSAMALIKKQNLRISALVVGDGPDRISFEEHTRSLNLTDRIFFTGSLDDVSHALCASDAFVHPGRIPEGFGLSIAEAMASSLPIIATNLWALEWTARRYHFGAIVEPCRPDQLANQIESMALDLELCRKMGVLARNFAHRFFDIRITANGIYRLYESTLTFGAKD